MLSLHRENSRQVLRNFPSTRSYPGRQIHTRSIRIRWLAEMISHESQSQWRMITLSRVVMHAQRYACVPSPWPVDKTRAKQSKTEQRSAGPDKSRTEKKKSVVQRPVRQAQNTHACTSQGFLAPAGMTAERLHERSNAHARNRGSDRNSPPPLQPQSTSVCSSRFHLWLLTEVVQATDDG